MPAEFILLSLPPWLRYKEKHILISMIIPFDLSAQGQKKYFEKVTQGVMWWCVKQCGGVWGDVVTRCV
jgi:hypothetical protein